MRAQLCNCSRDCRCDVEASALSVTGFGVVLHDNLAAVFEAAWCPALLSKVVFTCLVPRLSALSMDVLVHMSDQTVLW